MLDYQRVPLWVTVTKVRVRYPDLWTKHVDGASSLRSGKVWRNSMRKLPSTRSGWRLWHLYFLGDDLFFDMVRLHHKMTSPKWPWPQTRFRSLVFFSRQTLDALLVTWRDGLFATHAGNPFISDIIRLKSTKTRFCKGVSKVGMD